MADPDRSEADRSGPIHHRYDYFAGLYADDPDPWDFETSDYERDKYVRTLAALPRQRYRHGLEPGCANGALTALLAGRCDRLTAYDFVPAVVDRARRRLAAREHVADRGHVTVTEGVFPTFEPTAAADLIVWSEVGYYLTDEGLVLAHDRLDLDLAPGGDLVAVHYTDPTDYPMTGRAVHDWLDSIDWLRLRTRTQHPSFELAVWTRLDPGDPTEDLV